MIIQAVRFEEIDMRQWNWGSLVKVLLVVGLVMSVMSAGKEVFYAAFVWEEKIDVRHLLFSFPFDYVRELIGVGLTVFFAGLVACLLTTYFSELRYELEHCLKVACLMYVPLSITESILLFLPWVMSVNTVVFIGLTILTYFRITKEWM